MDDSSASMGSLLVIGRIYRPCAQRLTHRRVSRRLARRDNRYAIHSFSSSLLRNTPKAQLNSMISSKCIANTETTSPCPVSTTIMYAACSGTRNIAYVYNGGVAIAALQPECSYPHGIHISQIPIQITLLDQILTSPTKLELSAAQCAGCRLTKQSNVCPHI